MYVFPSGPGRMASMTDLGIPMRIAVEGWGGFAVMQAILTQLGLREECNVQFFHTLRNYIYVYVFGDRLADLEIGGLAMTTAPCLAEQTERSGFERVYAWWRDNRISRRGLPVLVTIGTSITIKALLVAASIEHADPTNGLAQFKLAFKYGPQRASDRETLPGDDQQQQQTTTTTTTTSDGGGGGGGQTQTSGGGTTDDSNQLGQRDAFGNYQPPRKLDDGGVVVDLGVFDISALELGVIPLYTPTGSTGPTVNDALELAVDIFSSPALPPINPAGWNGTAIPREDVLNQNLQLPDESGFRPTNQGGLQLPDESGFLPPLLGGFLPQVNSLLPLN